MGHELQQHIERLKPLSNHFSFQRGYAVYFHNAPQYWIRAMDFTPYFWNERRRQHVSTQIKELLLSNSTIISVVAACLNSSIFYWWFITRSDCRHLNMREISNFPIDIENISEENKENLVILAKQLMDNLKENSNRKTAFYKTTGKVVYDEFNPKLAKSIIDEIDKLLAKHMNLSKDLVDYIINYDIKYRMGREGEIEED